MVDYSRFDAIGLSDDDDDDDEKGTQHKASKTTQSHAEPTTADAAAGVGGGVRGLRPSPVKPGFRRSAWPDGRKVHHNEHSEFTKNTTRIVLAPLPLRPL